MMKKVLVGLVLGVFLVSLVFAANPGERMIQKSEGLAEELSIKQKVREGMYVGLQGERMQVSKGMDEKMKLRVRDMEVDTKLELNEERVEARSKLKVKLSNGRDAEVKIMPDVASGRAIERLKLKVCSVENNCNLELKEVSKGESKRLAYEVRAEKDAKIFGLFKAKMRVETEIDAETGEVLGSKKPWWAFLANDV